MLVQSGITPVLTVTPGCEKSRSSGSVRAASAVFSAGTAPDGSVCSSAKVSIAEAAARKTASTAAVDRLNFILPTSIDLRNH